jgi:pimeloyl-ACP methyl ester carboxylesterase
VSVAPPIRDRLDTGHMVMRERPAQLNAELRAFIAR